MAAGELGGPDGGAVLLTGHVDPEELGRHDEPDVLAALATLPCVVLAAGPQATAMAPVADAVVTDGDLPAVLATVAANPQAATALALLLRASGRRTIADGLVAESATYSTLQAGPEFARWRASRPIRDRQEPDEPAVRCEREGDTLRVTLHRPAVRNALDRRLRDELYDALAVAVSDPRLRVELRGDGPCYSSGGDLDEFGSRPDPATAHLVRLSRSLGWLLSSIAERVTAHVHGPCSGSGVELPAFAGHVVADPATTFALPEVSLGLVPGAGGTVSLPARIGRHRTALLALLGHPIDAPTALAWGLVDAVG